MSDRDFTTLRALWALRDDTELDPATWKVAVALLMFCDEHGRCRPGLRRLARVAKTSPGAVRKALVKLEAQGGPLRLTVERSRRTESGDADTNAYALALVGCDLGDPTCDLANPTCAQPSPTVGPGETHGCDQAGPTGVITQTTEEDLGRGSLKRTRKSESARRWRCCPAEWEPSDEHRKMAGELGVNFDIELASFRDHEFKDLKSDPDSTFRNWLRRARPARTAQVQQGGSIRSAPPRWAQQSDEQIRRRLRNGPRQPNSLPDTATDEELLAVVGAEIV